MELGALCPSDKPIQERLEHPKYIQDLLFTSVLWGCKAAGTQAAGCKRGLNEMLRQLSFWCRSFSS